MALHHKVSYFKKARLKTKKALHSVPSTFKTHCKQDPIYVLPEMKLHGRIPDFRTVSFLVIFVSYFRYSAVSPGLDDFL